MTIKEQLGKLKENWLLIVLVILVVAMMSGGNMMSDIADNVAYSARESLSYDMDAAPSAMKYGGSYYGTESFAPEVEERLITKNAYMTSETENGKFFEADSQIKAIIKASDAYLLNENVQKNGEDWKAYHTGYYSIKVDATKYEAVVSQLKNIGEVQSFSENAKDITGQHTDLQAQLNIEKERLARYKQMLSEATLTADKITLSDRIADQERTVKYYEDAAANMDNRISYSTLSVTLTEKQSEWANIVFVTFAEVAALFVESVVGVIYFVVWVLPWAVLFFVVRWIYRKVKKRK